MTNAHIVNTWFQDRIACGVIARETTAYNQAFAAKADLIARLDAASGDAPAPPQPDQTAADAAPQPKE